MTHLTDEDLLTFIAAKDETCLEELHERYAPYLLAMAFKLLKDRNEASQCVQDAFVTVWHYAGRFRANKTSAKTWLVTICRRLALNRLRGTKLDTTPLAYWTAPTKAAYPVDRIHVERALAKLDPEACRLIDLAVYQGFTPPQIAQQLEQPSSTVKTNLQQTLLQLREAMTMRQAEAGLEPGAQTRLNYAKRQLHDVSNTASRIPLK